MYAEDAVFWHPLFRLHGAEAVANYYQWWLTVNRSVDVKISGFSARAGLPLHTPDT